MGFRTRSDGWFSAYVALPENALSGDYYTVYHPGRSMASNRALSSSASSGAK
jgi:hypothetical protein